MGLPPGWYDDGFGFRRWWDGAAWTEWIDQSSRDDGRWSGELAPTGSAPGPAADDLGGRASTLPQQAKKHLSILAKVLLFGLPGIIVAGAATTVVVGWLTAEHWTVVDVPEHKETFRTEEYLTGDYIVEALGGSPCYVGQDWYACRNNMVDEYNRECAERSLTASSGRLCDDYRAELDRMNEVGEYGWVVESLGSYGYLRSTQESSTRQVSNNDYRPAITHEATCYLGFLGECPD